MRARCLLLIVALLSSLRLSSCTEDDFNLDDATVRQYQNSIGAAAAGGDESRHVRPGPATQPADGAPPASQPVGVGLALASRQPQRIVELTLEDALRRALVNSLSIKVESFSPGITAADVIIAEAAFDAVIFGDYKFSKIDTPNNNTLFPGGQDTDHTWDVGVKKELSTGGQISAKFNADRDRNNQIDQAFNPRSQNDLSLELTQPLLRGFGTDVNQAQIRIARNRRDISLFTFHRQVITTLAKVEQAYWNLYLARQALAIQQSLLAQTEAIKTFIDVRTAYDAMPVQVKQVEAAAATRRATVIRAASDVKDAEDQLKNLLNDPTLPLTEDIALLPTDAPFTERVAVEPEKELWAGLENRTELQEARANITIAGITKGVARNALLPKLDAFFQVNAHGMQRDFGEASERLFDFNYLDYIAGVSIELPVGNRAAKAKVNQSKLQLDQAVAVYHATASQVMTEILIALRDVRTSYDEILANREATQAAADNLSVLVIRREKLSPEYLNLQLQAQETLADTRRALQAAVNNYNNAIVRLEQAKGTLLRYDRVDLAPEKQ